MTEPGTPEEQGGTPKAGASEPYVLMHEVATALHQGRAPRSGRFLLESARDLALTGDERGSARALRLAALLELRRGNTQKALRPARSAERAIRSAQLPEDHAATLDLLARIHSMLGEHSHAIRLAERWQTQATSVDLPAARRRLSLAKWAAGEGAEAIELLEPAEAVAGAEEVRFRVLQSQMLIRIGCPTAAFSDLTRRLKESLPSAEEFEAHLARGWASLCLGQPDQAIRSFRRAARLVVEFQAPRKEVEAAVALATGEVVRAKLRGTGVERAQARLKRKSSQAVRMGLHHLNVDDDQARMAGATALEAATAKDAARALVVLTRAENSLALVDACCLEVERLCDLPPGGPAYAFTAVPRLSLE